MGGVLFHPPPPTLTHEHTHIYSRQPLGGQGWDFHTPRSSEPIQYSTQQGSRTQAQSLGLFAPSGPLTELHWQKHTKDTQAHYRHSHAHKYTLSPAPLTHTPDSEPFRGTMRTYPWMGNPKSIPDKLKDNLLEDSKLTTSVFLLSWGT